MNGRLRTVDECFEAGRAERRRQGVTLTEADREWVVRVLGEDLRRITCEMAAERRREAS